MENEKVDLRKISDEELQKIKTKALKLRDQGISNKEVAQKLNLDPTVLSRWYHKHVKNYRQPREVLKRGRKQGTQKKLTSYQEDMIIKKLQKYSALLDKELVQKIIEEQYKIKIPITTVGDYLKKWGVNSKFIMEFENEFVEKVGIDNYLSTKQGIMKKQRIIIWVTIMNYEIEPGINIYSISTRAAKNKLVFKFYREQIQPLDLIGFINQVAISFKKHLYVVFSTKNIQFRDNSYSFENSEKIIFIHDS